MSRKGCYVDNAQNRKLGRVGLPRGSHVVHKDGSETISRSGSRSSSCYFDTELREDRRLAGWAGASIGRGLQRCHFSHSSSSSRSSSCYVDNAQNRRLGRAGLPRESHVIHEDGSETISQSSSTSSGCYLDNAENRRLGRAGLPRGSHVVHRDGSETISSSHGGSESSSSCYVDNAQNRRLGQASLSRGSHAVHQNGSDSLSRELTRRPLDQHGYESRCIEAESRHAPRERNIQATTPPYDDDHAVLPLGQMLSELNLRAYVCKDTRPHTPNLRPHPRPANRPAYPNQYAPRALPSLPPPPDDWHRITPSMAASTKPSTSRQEATAEIPFEQLELDKNPIGRGQYGEVFAGRFKGKPIAFKKLLHQQMSRKNTQKFVTEVRVQASLDHPNIVKLFGTVVERGNRGIVMEFLEKNLFEAIFDSEEPFPIAQKPKTIEQISSALRYLHTREHKIAHCDVKCSNVLLDKHFNAKLTDFGLSAIKSATETSLYSKAEVPPGQGTPRYSAPEVLSGESMLTVSDCIRSDIYSLSIIIFELLLVEEAYDGLNVVQLREKVVKRKYRPTSKREFSGCFSQPLARLLNRCWDGCAANRPSAAEFQQEWSRICRSDLNTTVDRSM